MTNIKIVKLENGDDIVCSFPSDQLPEEHALLRITKPLQIKYIPQLTPGGFRDYVALVKWTAYTSDQVITIPKQKIMTITNATNEMQKSYVNIIKDYNVLDKVPERVQNMKYEQQRLSDEQNKEVNEIFNEFEDEDPTFH
tara:strand:- start:73 stop:492 length:420 start_codon:yes stop_codon:yes gene_type:complete